MNGRTVGNSGLNSDLTRSVLIDQITKERSDISVELKVAGDKGLGYKNYMTKPLVLTGLGPTIIRTLKRLKLCIYILRGTHGVYHHKEQERSMGPKEYISDEYWIGS